ncbi:NAD(P)-dependent dehydrogenase (short-subunit alcohol dehydrogenase family) [Pontibacter ummariensis]|uniref:NAD(P)-dependent dehydrogenase, short-chain alcohol dehydrogenase family n=1 Tax=Pontibacter ummariensis TaxID=1610492 RepID=A0A239HXJ7_9BACT|nr:glucose 1-dehydrogenase [Pontibacter ummariensis]PRY10106.1 NAD(P)-dependent dehydrogenase (short-subunit alcohol dehydrogenase family) [Pontibacter ummariensis]SNS85962.1 NAD(P)-dependent dehydrogenase, short-chain alcohol dehydrogenase family [Pontibacter ummariensis]
MATNTEKQFTGKVALVTGASSGIGMAAALQYAQEGASVVVSDIDEAGGSRVVEEIRDNGGEALFVKADVAKPNDCENLVKKTIAQYGRLDIAFNNAGIGGEANPVGDMSIEGWNKVIAVNLSSVFYCMKYQVQQMLQNGGGAIVNNSSILGQVGFANSAAYVAAKHGVVGLTKNGALEYSAKGIRINAVGPAFIKTPLLTNAGLNEEVQQQLAKVHPIGRLGESEEVAELVIWLSSAKASFVTGAYYAVDGAYLAQ